MSHSLSAQAESFAENVSRAISAFLGKQVPFTATARRSRFVITDSEESGVVVPVGEGRLNLRAEYRCELDGEGSYLKVLTSSVAVYAGKHAKGEPLFRYEYVHNQSSGLPAGHIHVHAHRDQFTRVMTLASVAGAKRRQASPEQELEAARLCKLHFPTGGHRFRPSLEDVLQLIEVEFGVTTGEAWPEVRDENRRRWRRQQTAAAVRDCPSEAVRVLQSLGYEISPPPEGERADNLERLAAF